MLPGRNHFSMFALPLTLGSAFLLAPLQAFAGPAADAVRAFYVPAVHSAMDEAWRDRFTGAAKNQLDANDKIQTEGEGAGCIDWDLAGDGQDFDEAEIARTLDLSEDVSGDEAEVTARFQQFPGPDGSKAEVVWTLRKVEGAWKVADIASTTSGWRLSELDCR